MRLMVSAEDVPMESSIDNVVVVVVVEKRDHETIRDTHRAGILEHDPRCHYDCHGEACRARTLSP